PRTAAGREDRRGVRRRARDARREMKKPRILVCNDDGINGPGLPALIAAMRRIGRVTVSVPEQERSADSHSLTLHKPIRVRRVAPDTYTLNGSPADCARFGVLEILKEK